MGDAEGGGLSPRERRAQRVKQQTRKEVPLRAAKYAAVAIIAVLVVAGIVWAFVTFGPEDPVHHHAAFRMYDDQGEVNFNHIVFDLQTTQYLRAHLHVSERVDHVLHIEGDPGLTMDRFFESLNIQTDDSRVRMNPDVHGGREVTNNETHAWQMWVDRCDDGPDNWFKSGALFDYQPTQHDRMLITFAPRDATQDSLTAQLDTVPTDEQIGQTGNDRCEGGADVGQGPGAIILEPGIRFAEAIRARSVH